MDNELKDYVDRLFKKYKYDERMKDLKEEILGNLEDKKNDLMASGLNEEDAIKKAKESIKSIDYLIDDNKGVLINKLKTEAFQYLLIYLLIGWIITIPFKVYRSVGIASSTIFSLILIVGILYITLYLRRNENNLNEKKYINVSQIFKVKKYLWIIWTIFIILSESMITAIYFGSNIWFSTPISISGPYEFGFLIIRYMVPMITIIIPLMGNKVVNLISKYEVGDDNE